MALISEKVDVIYRTNRCKCGSRLYKILDYVSEAGGLEIECMERGHRRWIRPYSDTVYKREGPLLDSAFALRNDTAIHLNIHQVDTPEIAVRIKEPAAGSKRNTLSRETQKQVFDRDGGKCQYCGSQQNIQYDHIIPFSKGGSDEVSNLQILCRDCNLSKGAGF